MADAYSGRLTGRLSNLASLLENNGYRTESSMIRGLIGRVNNWKNGYEWNDNNAISIPDADHVLEELVKTFTDNIENIIKAYIQETKYNIQNSLGNCSFFTKDVINWAKNKNIKADYVYMPLSEEYRKEHKIGEDFGGDDADWEDHIVPMINGYIIDFTLTDKGVSHKVRTKNTIPPKVFKFNKGLFEPNGTYGKWGYTNPEINTEYGNSKDINDFNVTEPTKKNNLKQESIDKTAGVWTADEK